MCDKCNSLKELYSNVINQPYQNYLPTIRHIERMVNLGQIELYAGDCLLEEVDCILYEEKHYTICHYLKCKGCNQFFFIGACIRGTPIYKTLDTLKEEKISNVLWGKCGTLFDNRKKRKFLNHFIRDK
ncbi:MAG: hypothetical protein PHP11_00885 [Erysipelotrichaceae bacterium]|nr:hypothetical protein [Erysipelotrichaceae bacterium]